MHLISVKRSILATVTKCLDNQKFYNFQQSQRKYCNNLTLTDLIILPVQRIPRYKLLVEQIFKRTQKNHPDFEGLQQALELIARVNMENNEKLKDLDSRTKEQISGCLLTPMFLYYYIEQKQH